MVSDSDPILSLCAVSSLVAMGRPGQEALISMLGESNLVVSVTPVAILIAMADRRSIAIPEMVPVILTEATNTVWQMRYLALSALHSIPDMADQKIEIIQAALGDTQPIVVQGALDALELNPAVLKRLKPLILGRTNWPHPELGQHAIMILKKSETNASAEAVR